MEASRRGTSDMRIGGLTCSLPVDVTAMVQKALDDWRSSGKTEKLWSRDSSLWTGQGEEHWLGWLSITGEQLTSLRHVEDIAGEVRVGGFSHAVLLGMGGSSLSAEVLRRTFGKIGGFPEMHVLDSTVPAQVARVENSVDLTSTLFVVSSKSGTTLESCIMKEYFFERVREVTGPEDAGSFFMAITDPGSKLEKEAQNDGFRHIFHGVPEIGGRYSALSNFGMVPAAVMGIDARRFLGSADEMAASCGPDIPVDENPGVLLGLVLGTLHETGRNKITVVTSPGIRAFGTWLEQLVAESTGKKSTALIPVDLEKVGPPDVYGDDRVFVYVRLGTTADNSDDRAVDTLAAAGKPVIRIDVTDPYHLGQEFFRWEVATAVAGSLMKINPFDQPDVEASKTASRTLTDEYEKTGSLPAEHPLVEDETVKLYTDSRNAVELGRAAGDDRSVTGYLRAHIDRMRPGDYFALLAFLDMSDANEERLQAVRHSVRDGRKVATCLGFGPRFLHSTGQAYKGGPDTGVFLQVTCDDARDIPVPGRKYSFGIVKETQQRGDFEVLTRRGRRALRVHLGADVTPGLDWLERAVKSAL